MHIGITISALWGLLEAWSQELMTSSWTEETLKDPLLLLLLLPAELADVVLIRRTGPRTASAARQPRAAAFGDGARRAGKRAMGSRQVNLHRILLAVPTPEGKRLASASLDWGQNCR